MSAELCEFVDVITALLSGENALRGRAEQRYENLKQQQPLLVLDLLFQVLVQSQLEYPARL